MGLHDSLSRVNTKINTSLNNIYATLSKYMTVPTGQSNRTLSKVPTYIEELIRDKNNNVTQLEQNIKSKDSEIANLKSQIQQKDSQISRLNKSIRDKESEISNLRSKQFDKLKLDIDRNDGQLKYDGSWLSNIFVQFDNGRFGIGTSEYIRMPTVATGTYYDELIVKFSKKTAGGGGYVGSQSFWDNRKVYVQIRADVTESGCNLSHMVTHDERWG